MNKSLITNSARRRRSITWSPVAAVLGFVAVELQTACRCTRQTNRRCTSRGRVLEYDVGIAHGSKAILQPLAVTMPGLNGFSVRLPEIVPLCEGGMSDGFALIMRPFPAFTG